MFVCYGTSGHEKYGFMFLDKGQIESGEAEFKPLIETIGQ